MPAPISQVSAHRVGPSGFRSARRSTILIVSAALVIAALTWIAVAAQIAVERRDAEREAIAQNGQRAMMLQQYVIRTLDAAAIATRHIAELDRTEARARLRGTRDRPALIGGPIAQNRAFVGLSVIDAQGNIVGSTMVTAGAMPNLRDHPAFQVHVGRDTGELFVGKPAASERLLGKVIWLSRRLSDADGRFTGVVAITMDPTQLTSIYEEAAVQESEVAWVVGLDGVVRARRTSFDVTAGEDIGSTRMFQLQARTAQGSYVADGPWDHQPRYVSVRRVPGYPLFVSYTVRRSEVLAPVEAHARVFLLVALLVTLATGLVAGLLIRALRRRDQRGAELAAAKQRLEEAQRVGSIGDWQVDLETRATRWSPQLFAMYRRDPALGAPSTAEFEAWLDPASLERHRAGAEAVRESGEAASWEIEARLPDGSTGHHLVSAVATRDEDGRIVGLHGTTQDIGDRKRLEALQAEVAHLSRVEAMNAMASTLAHELNQPLAAASNFLYAARRTVLDPARSREEAAEVVEMGRSQVALAGEIIRRVRSMVAREPTRLVPVALGTILDDVQALLPAIETDRRVEIGRDLAPDGKMIVGDRVQVQQVLMNLVRNAAQAAAGDPRPSIVVRSAPAADNQVRVSVEDNGPGFPADGEEPFSPFVTGKEGGLGLGLSISRTIIESHGGRIWAENREGGGGRVSFTLPAPPAA